MSNTSQAGGGGAAAAAAAAANDEDRASQAGSEVASSREATTELSVVRKILAETHQMLLRQADGSGSKARVLTSVRIPNFDGAQGTTVRSYREWRQEVAIAKEFQRFDRKKCWCCSSVR